MQIWAERIAQAAADDAPAPDGWETTTDADAHLDAGDGGGGGGGGSGGAACDGIQDWVAGNKIVRSGFLDKHRDASWKARWCELALEAVGNWERLLLLSHSHADLQPAQAYPR